MKRLVFSVSICLMVACSIRAQKTGHDVSVPDISTPQKGYQVVTTDAAERIATQQQAMADIKERLAAIDQEIGIIQADVRVLQNTNVIVNFLLGVTKFLIPGIIIAAFTVWFTKFLGKTKPPQKRSA
jgi:hypothetical protein